MTGIRAAVFCLGALGSFALAGCGSGSGPFEEKIYTPDGQIREIRVDVQDREIEISPSGDGRVHLQYSENNKEYYDISVNEEQVLEVTGKSAKEWTDYFGGKPSAENRKIWLQIPDQPLNALTLSTTNEEISLSPMTVEGSVRIASNGGDIVFERLEVGNALSLTVKNGDIRGTVMGSCDDFAVQSEVKKGECSLPASKTGGEKILNVSGNNGDVAIEFVSGKPDGKDGFGGEEEQQIPEIVEADWSEYFDGLNGTAVIYDSEEARYTVYNPDLAETRSSPCSTFKIVSSAIAMEQGTLKPEDSTRAWSGEVFWNEDWNRDVDFREAFRTSCVWYFRQVIDDIGKERMQEELEKLRYGNCDISDWEGRLNTNNSNRALTGFWIESSLKISPKEQTEVMERIFGSGSDISEEIQNELKQVMLVPEQGESGVSIYGKTGMGKEKGAVVDAWFTGFAEREEGPVYFCVRLGRNDGRNVSSTQAKEIAVQLVNHFCSVIE